MVYRNDLDCVYGASFYNTLPPKNNNKKTDIKPEKKVSFKELLDANLRKPK